MIEIQCTNCERRLGVKPEQLGSRFHCPACGERFVAAISVQPAQRREAKLLVLLVATAVGMCLIGGFAVLLMVRGGQSTSGSMQPAVATTTTAPATMPASVAETKRRIDAIAEPAAATMPATVPVVVAAPSAPAIVAGDLTPEALFEQASPAICVITCYDNADRPLKMGTGFFVSADGLVVTNKHVIVSAPRLRVTTFGKVSYSVTEVEAVGASIDLAVLRLPTKNAVYLKLATGEAKVGAAACAIGNPLGLNFTMSRGIVSGYRTERGERFVQTDAPVSPGSSGGPLLNAHGEVIGVMTFIDLRGQNLNFAIPAEDVSKLLASRMKPRGLPVGPGEGNAVMANRPAVDPAQKAMMQGQLADARQRLEKLTTLRADVQATYQDNVAKANSAYEAAVAQARRLPSGDRRRAQMLEEAAAAHRDQLTAAEGERDELLGKSSEVEKKLREEIGRLEEQAGSLRGR